MGTLVGYIGVGLLLIAYTSLLTKYKDKFYLINTFASLLLTFHAAMIRDLIFAIVNGWITVVMAWKMCQPVLEQLSRVSN